MTDTLPTNLPVPDPPDPVKLEALAAPFDPTQIGKLPRVTCRKCRDAPGKVCSDHNRSRCDTCGQNMSTAHMHIDYVGHAQVTARLNEVDPMWNWEPVAWDVSGFPAIIEEQGGRRVLWIRLTVLGVTRLGVGIAGGHEEIEKVLIGDALRNAAMRFGVALDLWAKGELHAPEQNDSPPPGPTSRVDPDAPAPIDWASLEWAGQDEHDAALEQNRARARALDPEAQKRVRAHLEGWVLPYTRLQMDGWADLLDDLSLEVPADDGPASG